MKTNSVNSKLDLRGGFL